MYVKKSGAGAPDCKDVRYDMDIELCESRHLI